MPTGLWAGQLVTAASPAGQIGRSGAGHSFLPSFSADGRSVVFVSQANNLVTNDDLGLNLDVFVRDLGTGRITLVSVATNGRGGAEADASWPSISSNGQFVAFASAGGNLVPDDTNGSSDVFVRDLGSGITRLVSADRNGLPPTRSSLGSRHPLISADGRWVFIESTAFLVFGSLLNNDVYVRDLQSNLTQLVSVRLSGDPGSHAGEQAELCSIIPDARMAAFVGNGTNFAPTATNSYFEVYVRDLQAGLTFWASSNVGAYFSGSPYKCMNAILSEDGRFIAFNATSSFGSPTEAALTFRHDLSSGTTKLVASNSLASTWPQLSGDGRCLAYDDGGSVFVWDADRATNILVSVSMDGVSPANGDSKAPFMTPDGSVVGFLSTATDLVPESVNSKFQVFVRDLVAESTRLVTVDSSGSGSSADHEFIEPALSADGLQVAFESADDNLVPDDFNRQTDAFLRDLGRQATTLLSERAASLPARTSLQNLAGPWGNCLSADGRFLAFSSLDNNLVPGDTNGWPDIFVHDLFTGSNLMVGVWTNAVVNPILSADGHHVLFTRPASFFNAPTDGDIYCGDLLNGTITLVNQRWDGAGPANQPARAAGISSDGRFVLFTSAASDLINQGNNSLTQVFLRDMLLGTNLLVSANLAGSYPNGQSSDPVLSPDGQWVAFRSTATDLVTNACPGGTVLYARRLLDQATFLMSSSFTSPCWQVSSGFVFSADSRHLVFATFPGGSGAVAVCDLLAMTNHWFSLNATMPSLSADGRLVACNQDATLGSIPVQAIVWDRWTGLTNLASVNTNGSPSTDWNHYPGAPLITSNGRYVVFGSWASDLVANDTNQSMDVFVRDLVASNTIAISRSWLADRTGNGVSGPISGLHSSGLPSSTAYQLGPDGRTVIFQSWASDLVEGDYNGKCDLFILRLGSGDSDGDRMDDDWEMAFFGTLARDGTGDFDGDGASDLDEFRAGTDPTNRGSVLRAMTLAALGSFSTTVLWPATAGKTYQVLYKDDLDVSPWTALISPIVIDGSTARLVDPNTSGHPHRFYRVVVASGDVPAGTP
jgi:Tol biopolymer transport system component